MGCEFVVVTEGRLDIGTWEQIFYGEFDGRNQLPDVSLTRAGLYAKD